MRTAVEQTVWRKTYSVCRVKLSAEPDWRWDSPTWREVPAEILDHYLGPRPDHFPRTEFKIGYDDRAVHLLFRVEDRFVRATAVRHQERVCGDSCVEFFFVPGPDTDTGYFNLEINCGGTVLFHHNREERFGTRVIERQRCESLVTMHSLPSRVEPELTDPVTWQVACSIPYDLLAEYVAMRPPQPRDTWRANVYKCADDTSHPHWLTWSEVVAPRPDFHLVRFFGFLGFR